MSLWPLTDVNLHAQWMGSNVQDLLWQATQFLGSGIKFLECHCVPEVLKLHYSAWHQGPQYQAAWHSFKPTGVLGAWCQRQTPCESRNISRLVLAIFTAWQIVWMFTHVTVYCTINTLINICQRSVGSLLLMKDLNLDLEFFLMWKTKYFTSSSFAGYFFCPHHTPVFHCVLIPLPSWFWKDLWIANKAVSKSDLLYSHLFTGSHKLLKELCQ